MSLLMGRYRVGLITLFGLTLCLFASAKHYDTPTPNPRLPLDKLPDARPLVTERSFSSQLVEDELDRVSALIKDKALERIWRNAYPNTLDTTVSWHDADSDQPLEKAFPRTFLVTGDITASWLRDSTSQINPYLHLLEKEDGERDAEWDKLYRLALGLLYMQSQAVLTHPYANSFGPPDSANLPHSRNDAMNPRNANADWVYPPAPGSGGGYWSPRPDSDYSKDIPNDGVTIFEAKWEVDSLANYFRLAGSLAKATNRTDFVNNRTWKMATQMALSALRSQQRETEVERESLEKGSLNQGKAMDINGAYNDRKGKENWWDKWCLWSEGSEAIEEDEQSQILLDTAYKDQRIKFAKSSSEWMRRFNPLAGGIYRFRRSTRSASETRSEDGLGEPVKYTGMVKSAFRPSDDATILPFFVPGNAQLAASLSDLVSVLDSNPLLTTNEDVKLIRDECQNLAAEVKKAIQTHAIVHRKDLNGDVFAYEADGYGSVYFMDDANVPSLLSLPYLGFVKADDATYLRTRAMVLSAQTNKYLFRGKAGWAIGGPHVGYGQGWPMSRSMQILTTTSKSEQLDALQYLRSTTAGTGLIHESVDVNDPSRFSRAWFAWTNGLFGEAILHVLKTNSDLLTQYDY